jgi:hypothetical protein
MAVTSAHQWKPSGELDRPTNQMMGFLGFRLADTE